MRFGESAVAAGLLLAGSLALRGELQQWVQRLSAGPLIALFFRTVSLPDGAVAIRRPPAETRAALSDAILVKPAVGNLYRLRAHEDERALDFTAAEADWRKYSQLQHNAAGYLALADYYHRREQAAPELRALQSVAALKTDPVRTLEKQAPWRATERILAVVDDEGLSPAVSAAALDAWLRLHPTDEHAYRTAVDFYIAKKQFDRAQTAVDSYARQFPGDLVYPVKQRATVAVARGSIDQALSLYATSFTPLWPAELTAAWFDLLQSQQRVSDFVGQNRRALQNDPADLKAAAILFHYFLNSHNNTEARRVLDEYRMGRNWTADQLWTVGQLYERLPDSNEAARCYYALYSLPGSAGATDSTAERALAALANLLLSQPEQPVAFGSGDLSFYRDIAKADHSPGFLNGILSLLFNSASPRHEFDSQNLKSVAYFHRAAAEQLVNLLAQRFPKADRLPDLRAALVQAYAAYSDNDAVVRSGRAYLTAFPQGAQRVPVALLLGDALATQQKEPEEFALYDKLLAELSGLAQHVPLGENAAAEQTDGAAEPQPAEAASDAPPPASPRSPDYQQVLDRYLARLSEANRPLDAVRLYRREIDRNPNDPGLYRQFAAYLDHNALGTQLVETYRRAMARFPDRSWYHSLARFYLRQKQNSDFQRLTREVTGIFSGSELETYFATVVASANLDASVYLQLNRFAHQRFPEDLSFVRNLMAAYRRRATQDPAAYRDLVRTYWYYDARLKQQYLSELSSSGRLATEIDAVRKASPAMAQGNWKQAAQDNPAAVQFVAEAEAWLSHFEEAAPAFRAVAEASPGDRELTSRGSSIYRSLAAFAPDAPSQDDTEVAVTLAGFTQKSQPRDRELLASIGDIYADRDQLAAARPVWNSILKIEPGKTESWLSAATVFWDYYMYDDALRVIEDGRRKFGNPALFAYQEGAIYEGRRDMTRAIQQYAAGAVQDDIEARSRLLRLAQRKATAGIVDSVTAALKPDAGSRALRIAVLEAQSRRDDLEAFLNAELLSAQTFADTTQVAEIAARDGFKDVEERATLKQVALTVDPIEKMRKQIELVRFYTARGDAAKAQQTMDALYLANPKVLGVVRAKVDFEKQQGHLARAIETLGEAARAANASLASQFTLEAARTATLAGQYGQARALLAGLLKADPYRPEYLAAQADTYASAKDDAGFEAFTLSTIKSLQASPLPPQERTEAIVALRRGLIPVLTREGAFDRATDQYIETINRYPEDENLTREAAQYAIVHSRLDQLTAFYRKTIHDAPRDYRWPIVLARVDTVAVDYSGAIESYELAMRDRPDRADLPQARAALEERLLRFDDAIRTYSKLYELTYHDPQWLERTAGLQARLGRVDEAVKDLRTAIIGDRKESAEALLEIANRLDSWNLPTQALPFAERGQNLSGVQQEAYFRILARTHRWNDLFIKGNTETNQAAQVIASEYTPEEKTLIDQAETGRIDVLPFVRAAQLAPLEAKLLFQFVPADAALLNDFNNLQTRRGLFGELGGQMEQLAAGAKNDEARDTEQTLAASAYVAEGDRMNALRLIGGLAPTRALPANLNDWLLATLSRTEPERLVQLAGSAKENALRDASVQYAIGHNDSALALRAVAARGAAETPLWTRAFTALTGVYFADPAPAVNAAFTSSLDTDATVGARVSAKVNRDAQLAGTIWYYYGARYGEYLFNLHRASAAELLPASLEATPGNPEAYMQLAGFYELENSQDNAITRYREALQLDATRGDAHDHIARILASHGKHSQALAEWRSAIAVYERMQSRGVAVPESFWSQATETIADIGSHDAIAELEPDLSRWIADYAKRNGEYRLAPLLDAAFDAALNARQSTAWVLDIAVDFAGDQTFLGFLANERLTGDQRVQLQRRRIQVTATQLATAHGDEQVRLEAQLSERRVELVAMLIDNGKAAEASAEWNRVEDAVRRQHPYEEILVASATGTLDQLVQSYRADASRAPGISTLLEIVKRLRDNKLEAAARTVAEFAYRRELDNQNLDASNFLGLAEVMLQRKQNPDAVALLQRMNLVSGEPFETFVPAAELLLRYQRTADAIPFLKNRVRAVPWDAAARVRLAGLLTGAERDALLNRVIGDRNAPYTQRVAAAEALAPRGTSAVAADSELAVLARGAVAGTASSPDARKPYRVAARIKAAAGGDTLPLLREALAIAPDDLPVRSLTVRAALANGLDTLALSLAPPLDNSQDAMDATLATNLSKAAERVDNLAAAMLYAGKAGDKDRVALLQKEQDRRAANAARQPVIGTSIEQAVIVRPRLLAGRTQ